MGTFDVLHLGHLRYLEQARRLGSRLVVVVARDRTVARLKGRPPVNPERDRVALVAALKPVDEAVLGRDYFRDRFAVFKKIRPQVVALGYDQRASPAEVQAALEKAGVHARVVRLKPFRPQRYKSSCIKKRFFRQRA